MKTSDIISINQAVLSGTPVFKGTRVPIETLFCHLEQGISLDEFLDDFPSVSKEQAVMVLELANKLINSNTNLDVYEVTA